MRACARRAVVLQWARRSNDLREPRCSEAGANPARPRHCNGHYHLAHIATGQPGRRARARSQETSRSCHHVSPRGRERWRLRPRCRGPHSPIFEAPRMGGVLEGASPFGPSRSSSVASPPVARPGARPRRSAGGRRRDTSASRPASPPHRLAEPHHDRAPLRGRRGRPAGRPEPRLRLPAGRGRCPEPRRWIPALCRGRGRGPARPRRPLPLDRQRRGRGAPPRARHPGPPPAHRPARRRGPGGAAPGRGRGSALAPETRSPRGSRRSWPASARPPSAGPSAGRRCCSSRGISRSSRWARGASSASWSSWRADATCSPTSPRLRRQSPSRRSPPAQPAVRGARRQRDARPRAPTGVAGRSARSARAVSFVSPSRPPTDPARARRTPSGRCVRGSGPSPIRHPQENPDEPAFVVRCSRWRCPCPRRPSPHRKRATPRHSPRSW